MFEYKLSFLTLYRILICSYSIGFLLKTDYLYDYQSTYSSALYIGWWTGAGNFATFEYKYLGRY